MKSLEKFFVATLLKISVMGVFVILIADVIIYPQDSLSIIIDTCIFVACIAAYFAREKFPVASILTITCTTLTAMFYQCLVVPANTTTSLSIILLVGFIVSILLDGKTMWVMHIMTAVILLAIFFAQFYNPTLRSSGSGGETVTIAITYFVIYFILTYFSGVLKYQYNKLVDSLRTLNENLVEKTHEIEAQNEELVQAQENLNSLNAGLEKAVMERTEKIRAQNEVLLKYSYANAHHLRGPVARLLGLAKIWKLESKPDSDFFFDQVEAQAQEIDDVIRQINIDLEKVEMS